MDLPVNAPPSAFISRHQTDFWEEALVTGNGRQGALCYGGPAAIRITFSHERLFLPLERPLPAPQTRVILPELRRLLADGCYAEAAQRVCDFAEAEDPGYARTRWIDPLVGAGTLTFTPAGSGPTSDYVRSTDFATGLVTQSWRSGVGTRHRAEAFASRPHDAVVIRISTPGGGAGELAGRLSLAPIAGTPPRPVDTRVLSDAARPGQDVAVCGGRLVLTGDFPAADWPGALTGYTVTCHIRRADDAITIVVRTTVTGPAGEPPAGERASSADAACADLDDLLNTGFDRLLAAHAREHGALFGRVRLDLGGESGQREGTSEDLLTGPATPARVERLFDAGRYAIISSTGTLPPTLQGVWSGTYDPAWGSGYTIDGNLQSAVAGLPSTGTPELMLPLFDLVESVLGDLRENADRLYGAGGIVAPAHLSSHGRLNHFGPVWCQTFWTAGAAWLSRLFVDYYHYTGDRAFLTERALPFMRLAADFYLDFLPVDGPAQFSPSYSPENSPLNTGSQACVDATMDVAVAGDLFRALIAATEQLGLDDARLPRWRHLLAALPPYRIGVAGELAEWCDPGLVDNHAHRHSSQLYPFWYEGDPTIEADPSLLAAAALAVRARLRWWDTEASDEMAYGLVQLGLAAAGLGMAEEAYGTVVRLAERYWRSSLVATHNLNALFNVDICGGLPAVVAAMLVRSRAGSVVPSGEHPARLDLLPALPAAWPKGAVEGLTARGPVTVRSLVWSPTSVEAVLQSATDLPLHVTTPGESSTVLLAAGEPTRLRWHR